MNKWLFRIHRWVGAVVGLFFLMWCLSGLVLVYHPFPNVDERDLQARMEPLPDSLPAVDSVAKRLSEGAAAKVRTVTVRRFQGQTLFDFETKDTTYTLCADSAEVRRPVTAETIRNVARRWVDAPIARIDTLHSRDQWIMYSRYLDEMPIAKCYFDDAAGHELYISTRTGEVLQFTDRSSRLWAYVGAIPHKFYLPILRRNNDVWIRCLTIGGVVALIAALSGLIVGLIMLRRNQKARGKDTAEADTGSGLWMIVILVLLGGIGGSVVALITNSNKKNRERRYLEALKQQSFNAAAAPAYQQFPATPPAQGVPLQPQQPYQQQPPGQGALPGTQASPTQPGYPARPS